MAEKLFIMTDQNAVSGFRSGVMETIRKANELINLFNDNQPFARINDAIQFVELANNPIEFYDQTLLKNIDHDSRLQADPAKLAELYSVPRGAYLEGLGLTKQEASKCHGCKPEGKQVTTILKCLSLNQYLDHSRCMKWRAGMFEVNTTELAKAVEKYNLFAESDQAIELASHYTSLCDFLNSAIARHKVSIPNVQTIAKAFGLLTTPDNKLTVNSFELSTKIKHLNTIKNAVPN